MTATLITLGVALLGPFVLTNWHISVPAIVIICGIILFCQALRITTQTPTEPAGSVDPEASPSQPSPTIVVFPIAIPAIVTVPRIAAIVVLDRHDLAHQTIVVLLLLGVMAINLITLLNDEAILWHRLAGVLPGVGWVLAALQAALAVQIVVYSLRLIEVLHWPTS